MPLDPETATGHAKRLLAQQSAERQTLDRVRRYWKGRQKLPAIIPSGAPSEVYTMARIARVNVIEIVVEALSQSLFVEGFRGPRESENHDTWGLWQANKFDKRQSGIHKAALAYGAGYGIVLPGTVHDPGSRLEVSIHGASPRLLTAEWGNDPDWPVRAIEKTRDWDPETGKVLSNWRLYDDEAVYFFSGSAEGPTLAETREHQLGVCPVVLYLDAEDLDTEDEASDESLQMRDGSLAVGGHPVLGQVAPLMRLQDQIDLITFNLLIAQHYGAFRQRYVIGWTAETENEAAKMAVSRLMAFEDTPEEIKVGEFNQTDLDGYIKSRQESMRQAASLSQTPVHELIGQMINLSAEALAAVEAGRDRKVDDRKTMFGESHEQLLRLAGQLDGAKVPENSEVVWRDTQARSFAAVVDALGKLATMLNVPAEELWEKIPGVTQTQIERWKAAAAAGDAFANLSDLLNRQAGGAAEEPPTPAPEPEPAGIGL
jgi:hypothetical protein